MRAMIRMGLAAGLILTGVAVSTAHAQQPSSGATWYNYGPGAGWARYAPASAPVVAPNAAASSPTTATGAAAGWAGYTPARAWIGYAPASSANSPTIVVNSAGARELQWPNNGARRRAAGLFVNHLKPQYASTLPAYEEYASGRRVPLAKPWMPLSP